MFNIFFRSSTSEKKRSTKQSNKKDLKTHEKSRDIDITNLSCSDFEKRITFMDTRKIIKVSPISVLFLQQEFS